MSINFAVMFFYGQSGNATWYYHTQTTVHWDDFIKVSAAGFANARPGDVTITIAFKVDPPNAPQRKKLSDLLNANPDVKKVAYHAFVTDSRLTASVNTAVNWISNKPWQEKTIVAPPAAFEWLARVSPNFDSKGVSADILARVPPEHLWPALR